MKMAFFITDFPRISESQALEQITKMVALGHEVDIYAKQKANTEFIPKAIIEHGLNNKVFYFGSLSSYLREPFVKPGALTGLIKIYLNLRMKAYFLTTKDPFMLQRNFRGAFKKYDQIIAYSTSNRQEALFLKDAGLFSGNFVTEAECGGK